MHRNKPSKNLSADQFAIDSISSKKAIDSNIQNLIQPRMNILGEFLIVPQMCLTFGRLRKEPVNKRPAISLTRSFTGVYVCPCSSKPGMDKFKLPHTHVKWTGRQSKYTTSYVFWQYERVIDVIIMLKGKCVGQIDSEYRGELTRWLNNRESCLYKQQEV